MTIVLSSHLLCRFSPCADDQSGSVPSRFVSVFAMRPTTRGSSPLRPKRCEPSGLIILNEASLTRLCAAVQLCNLFKFAVGKTSEGKKRSGDGRLHAADVRRLVTLAGAVTPSAGGRLTKKHNSELVSFRDKTFFQQGLCNGKEKNL